MAKKSPPKSLDTKLALLTANRSQEAFILADAKDADMAFGITTPGPAPTAHPGRGGEGQFRSLADYRDQMRQIIAQGLVDIMLMSASSAELLKTHFQNSPVTPAVRANDTTDVHIIRHSSYRAAPSKPFRSATIDSIQQDCSANLALYSVTFNNLPDQDLATMEAYKSFRLEAQQKNFHHFLEIFDPNIPPSKHRLSKKHIGPFVNDHIARLLAGITKPARPLFLKLAYHGPQSMEELCSYDPSLIVGIMGGAAGTTHDAFHLLAESKKYGARVALFGRKINAAEHQLSFVHHLRQLADNNLTAADAVRSYHNALAKLNLKPTRPLKADLELTIRYH